jgi:hypothetical protein
MSGKEKITVICLNQIGVCADETKYYCFSIDRNTNILAGF